MFLNTHFSSYFKDTRGWALVSPCVKNKLAWVQVVSVCTWEEGLEMGIRQHPTCPREVIHPGLSPVWALRMKGQEAQNGLAR